MIYRDWLGQEITVGSTILYAVSNSHYAQVVYAEVLEVLPTKDRSSWSYGRAFKLKVQPLYESGPRREEDDLVALDTGRVVEYEREPGWEEMGDWWTLVYKRALPKPVFIQNVEKVTVFEFPPGVRERLDAHIDAHVRHSNERVRNVRRERAGS